MIKELIGKPKNTTSIHHVSESKTISSERNLFQPSAPMIKTNVTVISKHMSMFMLVLSVCDDSQYEHSNLSKK